MSSGSYDYRHVGRKLLIFISVTVTLYADGIIGSHLARPIKIVRVAYPSGNDITSFVLHYDSKTWIDAYQSCKEEGSLLYSMVIPESYMYIKSVNSRSGRAPLQTIWTGIFKPEDKRSIINSKDCKSDSYRINGTIREDLQCVLMNMSSTSEDSLLQMGSCAQELPYLCVHADGEIEGTTDAYVKFPNTSIDRVHADTETETLQNRTLHQCIMDSFKGKYTYIGLQYNHLTSTCVLYETNADEFPVSVTLNLFESETVVLKNTSRVLFTNTSNISDLNYSRDDFPCVNEKMSEFSTTKSTKEESCVCPCKATKLHNKSEEEIFKEIIQRTWKLKLNKTTLSSYKRQKISATDDRISSLTIGGVAVTILVSSFALIVACDVPHIVDVKKVKRQCGKLRINRKL